ncbi:LysE family transporter [Arthrobacter sp. Y-9]|uniref:LysE family transporter n=1 Tax=Arthrobacter sp. Y-9 TaxID=3039385 RepID=UPI00241D9D03|nr:LysE family transporter [Arthrobacter sp. Y-9]WFR84300.1 LysE family transporter [Arthrobacter sp. Y-9]
MNDLWAPTVAGIAAGLGVAMPVGAIAAMLLREGLVNGFKVGAAAAMGVATVDVIYCVVATATSRLLVQAIESHRGIFLLISGALVIAIGAWQLHQGSRQHAEGPAVGDPSTARTAYFRFVALTAFNPLTLVYFVALGGAVTAPGTTWVVAGVFVASAGLASLAWQLVLVSAGAFFRRALTPRIVHAIGIMASLLILALGFVILVSGVQSILT